MSQLLSYRAKEMSSLQEDASDIPLEDAAQLCSAWPELGPQGLGLCGQTGQKRGAA